MDYKHIKKRLKNILLKSLKPNKIIKEDKDALSIGADGRPLGNPDFETRKVLKPGGVGALAKPSKGPGHKPNAGVTYRIVDVAPQPSYELDPVNYNLRQCHKDFERMGDIINNINTNLTQDELSKLQRSDDNTVIVIRDEE